MASLFPRALLRRPLTALPRAATASRASTCRAPVSAFNLPHPAAALRPLAARRFYSDNNSSNSSNSNKNNNSGIPPPPPPPPPKPSSIKFWPFVVVIALGSGGYMLLVNQRNNNKMSGGDKKSTGKPSGNNLPKPTFSTDDVSVVFVLGGPGAGKGTQCARLVKAYGFTHLSAGDLLRAEQDRPGSEFGQLIKDCIRDGAIVPLEVTVKLLENAMQETIDTKKSEKEHKFLIDGFPRKMDQAIAFEQAVCPAKLVLFYDCPEDELERRLMERGKTSGRADDNAASIRKRFRTFVETSMPVVDAYEKEGRVVKIDATSTPDKVFAATQKELGSRLSL